MDFDKIGIKVLFVAMTGMTLILCGLRIARLRYFHVYRYLLIEENQDLLAQSGFFQKCSKRWLFPSIQDAVEHAMHGLPLVCLL